MSILSKRSLDQMYDESSPVDKHSPPSKYYRLNNILTQGEFCHNIDHLDKHFDILKNIVYSIPNRREYQEQYDNMQYIIILFQIIKNIITRYQNNYCSYTVDDFYMLMNQIKTFYYSIISTLSSIIKYLNENNVNVKQLTLEINRVNRKISWIIDQKFNQKIKN